MTFEEALFQEDAKDINKLNKQTKNANAAKAKADEANQDLQNKQNIANDMIKACQEIFGLKQGGTLGPKDILAKIKADPSILDKIVANQGIMQQIGNKFPKETIEQLKTAPMLNAQEAVEDTVKDGPIEIKCSQTSDEWNFIVDKLNTLINPQPNAGGKQ